MHTRRWFAPLMVLTLLASVLITPASFAQEVKPKFFQDSSKGATVRRSTKGSDYVAGQLIVRMRDGSAFMKRGAATTQALQARFASVKLKSSKQIATGMFRLDLAENADIPALARKLAADPEVAYAQPNYRYQLLRTVNDPLSTFQYGLNKINAYGAWDMTTGSSTVKIAIIDSGVRLNHPDFTGRVLPGYDFANNDADASDDVGHGTHVAGIAAAAGDNGEGVAGMCWQCSILPVKVGGQDGIPHDALVSGIRWAADQGARVINLSLGGEEDSPAIHEAIKYAVSKNVVVVVAAGNSADEGNPVEYPAAYDEVIAVGATDHNDQHVFFSQVQPYVDVSAPGWNIASTWSDSANFPFSYVAESGTSMAAPYVAGLAGLILSINPNLDVNAVRSILTGTVDDLGNPGADWQYGAGRINAARAVSSVRMPQFDPVPNPNQNGVLFFPETQHTLRGTFKDYWAQNGGLAVFGFPISEEFQETSAEGTFTVQYFERNRFEAHPEKAPPYHVLLGRLSDVQLKRQGRDWFTFPKGQPTNGCQFFAETGHSVCEPFLSYWKKNGLRDPKLSPDGRSLALFGMPLSEPAPEVNTSGENVVTQWFERARFEFHPDKPQEYQVLLGLLGNETARPGGSTTQPSGQMPPDRCGPIPPPVNATLAPASCVVIGTYLEIDAGGFQPVEEIAFVIVRSDGAAVELDPINADEQGRISGYLQALLPPGVYGIGFKGKSSGNESIIYVKVVDR
ncbi:MAG TPA: S8 family peptidase [Herpetosiphonaceae bacterium]